MLIWAVESGCTRSVAFANICFDSENADSAFLFHFKSKFDFGDSLVCPSLAAVSRLLSGVNFAEFVDVSYAFYDLGWLPVVHPNKQKRNQVRV